MRPSLSTVKRAVRGAPPLDRTDEILYATGSLQCRLQAASPPASLAEAEFRVFSQFGEDGAIQYLIHRVGVPETTFVEIGVESYRESNTRFLALHDNWRGMAVDGDRDHVAFLESNEIGWRADILPVSTFVTRENINQLFEDHGFAGELGLLSIDVDGNDYWLLDALHAVSPAILVLEFNGIFGPTEKVTIPYDPGFVCHEAHWSYQYFGASLAALELKAKERGYALVGVTSNAVNAFFVRRDLLGELTETTAAQAWRPSRFLSSRDETGHLSRVRAHPDRLRLIRDLPLVDVETGSSRTIAEIYGV